MAGTSVLIADDHSLFRQGLRALLEPPFAVSEAREGEEAVRMAIAQRPAVAVLDIVMPGIDGIEAARQIKKHMPQTSVVIVSAVDDDDRIFEAIQAGACGYVVKDEEPEHIVRAVQNAAEGNVYLPPLVARRVLANLVGASNGRPRPHNTTTLSDRELSVLRLMVNGKRNREIAAELCISERTVGIHVTNVYNKLGVYDRAEAVLLAIKKRMVRF